LKLFENIFKFNGGIKAETHKTISTIETIKKFGIPKKIILPLRQHIGRLAKININIGDYVLKGQLIANADGNVSAAIHAPTSGHIESIEKLPIPHPSGLPDFCVVIKTDGKDTWINKKPIDWKKIGYQKTVELLISSGIVGLGGATFPSHLKLTKKDHDAKLTTLIINAAECEPYITCDDMLMRERVDELIRGINLLHDFLEFEESIISIEDNKIEAIEKIKNAIKNEKNISLKIVPTIYPSGDAKRLIYLTKGIKIPKNTRSSELGIQMFNVATIVAIYRFLEFGEPSLSRIITITGNVKKPRNYEVLFGTPLEEIIIDAGGQKINNQTFIMGGPMMGFALPSIQVPVTKAMNCIISAEPQMLKNDSPVLPCIRCARCAEACPVELQPQELYWFSKSKQLDKVEEYNLFDCIECGCCSYVCPSNIPLVQYYRFAKSEIIEERQHQEEANIARERNEFRLSRLEREKIERAERNAQRRAQTSSDEKSKLIEEKRKAIQKAMERVNKEGGESL
jgi:electron transport complex protein RnfC